jgi:hypothetical protein
LRRLDSAQGIICQPHTCRLGLTNNTSCTLVSFRSPSAKRLEPLIDTLPKVLHSQGNLISHASHFGLCCSTSVPDTVLQTLDSVLKHAHLVLNLHTPGPSAFTSAMSVFLNQLDSLRTGTNLLLEFVHPRLHAMETSTDTLSF